jgi:hypothetical protein
MQGGHLAMEEAPVGMWSGRACTCYFYLIFVHAFSFKELQRSKFTTTIRIKDSESKG